MIPVSQSRRSAIVVGVALLQHLVRDVFPWVPPPAARRPGPALAPRQRSGALAPRSEAESPPDALEDLEHKVLYQRIFYRVEPASTVAVPDAVVVEERVRFEPDPDPVRRAEGYIKPVGPRTLILRDGAVADGAVGGAVATLDVHEHADGVKRHNGAGQDLPSIATVLFLASNPALCRGHVLELSSNTGICSLLGSLGAGFVFKGRFTSRNTTGADTLDEDILSIPHGTPWLSDDIESITLTETDESKFHLLVENAKCLGVPAGKINIDKLDWISPEVRPPRSDKTKEYRTVIANNIVFSFPGAKQLAKAVAHRLEPSYSFVGSSSPAPKFIHVFPDANEDSVYLRRFLEKGYRMRVDVGYLQMQTITLNFQVLPKGEPESSLDDLPLKVQESRMMDFTTFVAEHSVDYGGAGTGEYFFPIETGQFYDSPSGDRLMETEWDSN